MAKSSADGVDLVAPFLTAARRRPSLGRQEEEELTRRWVSEGDRASANSLARAHQRQVLALAMKYRHYQVPINELVAEGNLGLVRALQKFRPERGVRFGTYASYWIRAFMFDRVIKSRSAMVGDGGALRSSLFFKLRRERARVATQHGDGEVAEQALAERLGVSGSKLKGYLQRIDSREVSLEAEGPGGAPSEVDRLSSPDDQEVELSRLETAAGLRDTVKDALHLLDEREQFIVRVRVMADGAEELSLAEIARRLKVSRERARQLETRALGKLRRSIGATTNPIVKEWLANEHPPQAPSA